MGNADIEAGMECHLAAILIADVVGYGRLSRIDEGSDASEFSNEAVKLQFRIGVNLGDILV